MQKTIIDLVVNKVNIAAYHSLVGGESYDKEEKEEPIYRSVRFKSTYMYVCSQSAKGG